MIEVPNSVELTPKLAGDTSLTPGPLTCMPRAGVKLCFPVFHHTQHTPDLSLGHLSFPFPHSKYAAFQGKKNPELGMAVVPRIEAWFLQKISCEKL